MRSEDCDAVAEAARMSRLTGAQLEAYRRQKNAVSIDGLPAL